MTQTEFARRGGKERAKALSKERRIEIARAAGLARQAKRRQLASKQQESDQIG